MELSESMILTTHEGIQHYNRRFAVNLKNDGNIYIAADTKRVLESFTTILLCRGLRDGHACLKRNSTPVVYLEDEVPRPGNPIFPWGNKYGYM